jgi:hypothetical protein
MKNTNAAAVQPVENRKEQRRQTMERRKTIRFGGSERRAFQDRRALNVELWDSSNPF